MNDISYYEKVCLQTDVECFLDELNKCKDDMRIFYLKKTFYEYAESKNIDYFNTLKYYLHKVVPDRCGSSTLIDVIKGIESDKELSTMSNPILSRKNEVNTSEDDFKWEKLK